MNIQELPSFLTRGFLGVDMFFVLSGYLIVTLILREKERNGFISLRKFYIRRALRIFPVYYGVLLIVGLYYYFLKSESETRAIIQLMPYYLTFTSNWLAVSAGHLSIYWSLATEEQFYLLWPFLEKKLKKFPLFMVMAVFIIINQWVNFSDLNDSRHLEILDTTFTPICLGVILAHVLHNYKTFSYVFFLVKSIHMSFIYFVMLLLLIYFSPQDISGFPRLMMQFIMMVWLASLVMHKNNIMSYLLDAKLVSRIGETSYGIYLYHMLAFAASRILIEKLDIHIWGYELFIIGGLMVILIAELSYRYYEKPFMEMKRLYQ